MHKEIIIIFVIIILVASLEFVTQKYTSKIITEMIDNLSELKNILTSNNINKEEISAKISEIDKKWSKYHDTFSLYIEHNELEKVETYFVSSKSLINSSEFVFATSELEKSIFILEHISDKYAFNLSNIF